MKICLIIDDYLPDSIKVGAKMMHELAVEFKSLGHEVTIIAPSDKLSKRYDIIEIDGVSIWRFSSGKIKNVPRIQRAINETLLSLKAWFALKSLIQQNHHHLIVYYSPSIFWGSLVSRLKKEWSCNSYLILRDLFPQWVIDNGILRANSLITKYFRYFERLNYNSANVIGIQSPNNIHWFLENHCIDKPLELLYNWASLTKPLSGDGYYKKKLGLDNKVVFFYGGNIGHAQDMMNIVKLAKSMVIENKAHFVLVGAGDEVHLVERLIVEMELDNITLLPSVSQEEFQKMLSDFDVGLFSLHSKHTTHNFPGKLMSYMSHEKPILGSVNPNNDIISLFSDSDAGFITVNGDDELFLMNALTLLHDDSKRKNMGVNSKNLLFKNFSVTEAAKQILVSSASNV